MANPDQLRKKRGALRAGVTRALTLLTDLLQQPDPDASQISGHMDYLKDKETALSHLDDVILETTDEENLDQEVGTAQEYNEKILYAVSRAKFWLQERERNAGTQARATEPGPSYIGSPNSGDAAGQVREHRQRSVQLPKLQIPTFDGSLRGWQSFWDHFDATIHTNAELPRIEKFKYLLTYLTGSAKRAIEGIRLAEQNYDLAIKTFTDRFGRRDLLVNEHIDHLLVLSAVKCSSEVQKLRLLRDNVQFHVSALEGLGVSPDQYTVVLNRVLMRCLPEDLAIMYRQKTKETNCAPSIAETPEDRTRLAKEMLTFLRIQVEIREEGRQLSRRALQDEPRTHMPQEIYGAEPIPSASALTGSALPVRPACPLCQSKDHTIAFCNADLSAEEKRARLQYGNCCFRCGTRNHVARLCRKSINIRCGTCHRRHLTILCELSRPAEDLPSSGGSPAVDEPPPQPMRNVTTAQSSHVESTPVLLQTGRVWAESGDRRLLVRILLDSGSQRTYIRADVAKLLKCSVVGNEELSLVTFGGSKSRRRISAERVNVRLRSQFGASAVTLEAFTIPEICCVTSPPLDPNILYLLGEREYNVADSFQPTTWQPEEISVLIGSDAYWQVTTGKIDRISSTITAINTTFGWMVQGPMTSDFRSPTSALFVALEKSDSENIDVSLMWRLDAIEIDEAYSRNLESDPHMSEFKQGISKQDGRYQVPLMVKPPWLPSGSNNRRLAERRLRMQINRFREQSSLLQKYDEAISAYFNDGHAEKVQDEQPLKDNVYYMPHHAVVRRDAVTTKLRVVFDASSHEAGHVCLNDVLSKGVKLGSDVIQLLLNFRCQPVVLAADIKKAYLQLLIRPQDRDLLRFLWLERLPTKEEPMPPITTWRMTRVPFGAASSPFLLAATLRHHLSSCRQNYPTTVSLLEQAFYADDLLVGLPTAQEALKVYEETRQIFREASMELRKWASNCDSMKERFLHDKCAIEDEAGDSHTMKVLGVP
ncbi:uncharacterized protein LOC119398758 [Rhipicephalus sanguineus]|uniref:uncharacterized protein LOC119398758 n=1 Tax=Rhipicephalus sanguineus TaxID=34632 RepID=UPI001895BE6D|nr:uncharacterized protein LOC119398758 [Rhipicephalus sanguineus]